MAYNEDASLSVLNDLTNAQGGADIPGLSVEEVVPGLVEAKHGDQLAAIENEEARNEKRAELEDYYSKGKGKTVVQMEIAKIKTNFASAKSSIETVAKAAVSAVASNAVPAVITVGQAASTPNPGYATIENQTKKAQLQATLNSAAKALTDLVQAAIMIAFPLPGVILAVIKLLTTTKKAVDAIPG